MNEPTAAPAWEIASPRLRLLAADAPLLDAEMRDPARFAELLRARVPTSWPPDPVDEQVMDLFRESLATWPEKRGWWGWYILLREADSKSDVLIGSTGFSGPPDDDGSVEIGYSLLPEYFGRGFATEAVTQLVQWAFRAGADNVAAQVKEKAEASKRVLRKNGFACAGPGREKGSLLYVLHGHG